MEEDKKTKTLDKVYDPDKVPEAKESGTDQFPKVERKRRPVFYLFTAVIILIFTAILTILFMVLLDKAPLLNWIAKTYIQIGEIDKAFKIVKPLKYLLLLGFICFLMQVFLLPSQS